MGGCAARRSSWWFAAAMTAAGCGRFDFDERIDSGTNTAGDTAAVDPDLLLWLEMETDPAAGVVDSSSFHRSVTCTGSSCPTLVPGLRGMGYQFDGIDDILRVPMASDFAITTGTVAIWFRAFTEPPTGMTDVLIGKPYNPASSLDSFEVTINPGPDMRAGGDSASGGYCTPKPFTLGTWQHLAFTVDATAAQAYVDGAPADAFTLTALYDGQDLMIGGDLDVGAPASYVRGVLDEVRIYRRVLSPAEIQAIGTP